MFKLLIAFLMFFTLLTVFLGVFVMVKGGKINKKYANLLMRLRIFSQFSVIILLFLYFLLSK